MLYRDDDINRFTDLATFIKINDLFVKHNKIHTCSIEMFKLWESRGIFHLLNTLPNIEIGLHCFVHRDYSILSNGEAYEDIKNCLTYWQEKSMTGYGRVLPIKTFYPPWNKSSTPLHVAAKSLGLEVNDSTNPQEVFGFHWWEFAGGIDLEKLEEKLKC